MGTSVDRSEALKSENLQQMISEEHNMETADLHSQQSSGECILGEGPLFDTKITGTELLDKGYMQHGVLITDKDAVLEPHVAMKFFIVVIAIMTQEHYRC
ncbi:unnamed protein product [Camellia sinensis]